MITKVLVTVMTYPALSEKHFETVCTAGFREDGTWIRIFPVAYRVLFCANESHRYHKWQWIEVDLEQDINRDIRKESFHIRDISTLKILSPHSQNAAPNWDERLQWVFRNKKIYRNMTELLQDTKQYDISLAVLKPMRITDFHAEREDLRKFREKSDRLKKRYKAELNQMRLFEDDFDLQESFQFAEKVPYKFSYSFMTEDGKERKLMIEDWEIGNLYRNTFKKSQNEQIACEKVRDKLLLQ